MTIPIERHLDNLIIVGGQAYTPEEYEGYRKYVAKQTAKRRERRQNDPVYREHWNTIHRERRWQREGKEGFPIKAVASLHSLRCTGATKSTGCRCRKAVIYERVEGGRMDRPSTQTG